MMQCLLVNIWCIVFGIIAMLIGNDSSAYILFGFSLIHSFVALIALQREKRSKRDEPVIGYVCDEKQSCNSYCKDKDDRYCHHTLDIKHAANFEEIESGMFVEKVERKKED